MQIYPAIKARMGRWEYFIVRMSMRELAQNIRYAEEIHGPTQLSDAIQRQLNKNRATNDIAKYLVRQPDRFFSSIVVAVLDGEPQWSPVSLEENPEFRLLKGDTRLSEAFGILTFNGEQNYYALDGQHRLAAIRLLLDKETDFSIPPDFRNEEVSVICVIPREMETESEFLLRYRRLFGNLNRYAKPMSQYDNIVMDEDDAIAIITRRLVSDHPFFAVPGSEFDSSRVKMASGRNLTPGSNHYTTLEILYAVNTRLLASAQRRNEGWGSERVRIAEYTKFRPPEEEVDSLESELMYCWDSILDALPILKEDPSRMRVHNPLSDDDETEGQTSQDSVLFWPIGQILMADLVRVLLDDAQARSGVERTTELTPSEAARALAPLADINWEAHSPPWRHILLVRSELGSWRIASEDRDPRLRLIERIIRWQIGLDHLSEDEISGSEENSLYGMWKSYLPLSADEDEAEMWQTIEGGLQR